MRILFWRKKRRSRPSWLWLLTLIPASAVGTLYYRSRQKSAQRNGTDGQERDFKTRNRDESKKSGAQRMKNASGKDQKASQRDKEDNANLEVVEGIGPKIAAILRAEGITTLRKLANTSVDRLNEILDAAGLRISQPDTWPEQARLAADDRWDEFNQLKDTLRAGRRVK